MGTINEVTSNEDIRKRIQNFYHVCKKLNIHTTNKNPVCQRLQAAEKFCAATEPIGNENLELLIRTGEFLWLADCLEYLGERIKGTIHIDRLVLEKTHANELAELTTAYLVEQSGYRTSLDEPDVIAHVGTQEVGLACKKLDSEQKLLRRASEARNQIRASKKQGIVVIDIGCIVAYPTGAMYANHEQAYNSLALCTDALWDKYEKQLLDILREPTVESLLFMNSQFCTVRQSVDHEKKIVQGTSFHSRLFSFRSKLGMRSAQVWELENAIMRFESKNRTAPSVTLIP